MTDNQAVVELSLPSTLADCFNMPELLDCLHRKLDAIDCDIVLTAKPSSTATFSMGIRATTHVPKPVVHDVLVIHLYCNFCNTCKCHDFVLESVRDHLKGKVENTPAISILVHKESKIEDQK